ncbi:hypothetical protein C6341_g9062 [Phytophthora cactorum]|nr:hypothetical protein C6341_g9062 [Phytophthora cactorum]
MEFLQLRIMQKKVRCKHSNYTLAHVVLGLVYLEVCYCWATGIFFYICASKDFKSFKSATVEDPAMREAITSVDMLRSAPAKGVQRECGFDTSVGCDPVKHPVDV